VDKAITGILIILGLLHLLPVVGVVGPDKLAAMYGVTLRDPNLVILMRHRAILFGLLGAFVVYAAFVPAVQPLAFVAVGVSMVTFVLIAYSVGSYNEAIKKVALSDVMGSVLLLVAVGLYVVKSHQAV
jgi:hypothetical protein